MWLRAPSLGKHCRSKFSAQQHMGGDRGIVSCSSQRELQTAEQFIDKKLETEEGWETGRQIGIRQANRTLMFEGH